MNDDQEKVNVLEYPSRLNGKVKKYKKGSDEESGVLVFVLKICIYYNKEVTFWRIYYLLIKVRKELLRTSESCFRE